MKKLIFALLIPLFLVSCYWDADFVDVIYKEIPTDSEEIGEETGPGSIPYYLKEDDGTVYITEEEIEYLIQAVTDVVAYLRSISPFWRDLQTGKRPHVFAK